MQPKGSDCVELAEGTTEILVGFVVGVTTGEVPALAEPRELRAIDTHKRLLQPKGSEEV